MLAHKPVIIRALLLIFVFGVLPSPCPAEDLKKPKPPTPQEQVLATEKKLFDALVNRDLAALDELLSQKLTFRYANGKTQTKQELINAVRTGEVLFKQLDSDNPEVIPIKDAAIVSGTASIDFHNDSPHRYKRVKYLALFVKEDN